MQEVNKLINYYIDKIKDIPSESKGSNKECFVFDNYVLLRGNSVDREERAIQKIKIMHDLKEKGINIAPLLEYTRIDNKDYELQMRAPGEELYNSKMSTSVEGQKKYLERLKNISLESPEFYDKFITDWNAILETGLDVDPSKSSNFFYQKGSICFIDLNKMDASLAKREEYKYMEMAVVLRGGGLPWFCDLVTSEALELIPIIYQKLGESIIRNNGDIDKYISQIDPDNRYKLSEYFKQKENTKER